MFSRLILLQRGYRKKSDLNVRNYFDQHCIWLENTLPRRCQIVETDSNTSYFSRETVCLETRKHTFILFNMCTLKI